MTDSKPRRADRSKYILLSPLAAKILSAVSLGALHLWFVMKLFLVGEQPALQLAVGFAALTGFSTAIAMFLCTYSFVANAPVKDLDEREVQERNAAYLKAYAYAVAMILIGYIGSDLVGKVYGDFKLTSAVVTNFLNLTFFSCLIMPATILAWRDQDG